MNRVSRATAAIFLLLAALTGIVAQDKPDALKEYLAGNSETAVQICLGEIREAPQNLEAYIVLTWSLTKLGKYAEAELYARKAKAFAKNDVRITEALGEALYNLGRNDEALKLFQEYALLAPEGSRIAQSFYFSGEIYLRQGKFQHADISFTTACLYESDNARYWSRLGYAREQAQDFANAVSAYKRSLQANSRFPDAALGLERLDKQGYR